MERIINNEIKFSLLTDGCFQDVKTNDWKSNNPAEILTKASENGRKAT
jgi:hypothetical protein